MRYTFSRAALVSGYTAHSGVRENVSQRGWQRPIVIPFTPMDISDRFSLSPSDRRGIEAFTDYIWTNSELCNQCFSRVRAIGELKERRTDLFVHHINEYYERTESGSQEHNPFDSPADRYGHCFCLECGSDLSADDADLDWATFQEYAKNVYFYTRDHTPLDLDHRRFGRECGRLKRRSEYQNCDRQILAIAFARALAEPPAQARAESSAAPAD